MRNDIYVGVLVSVGLHSGLAFINRSSIHATAHLIVEEKVIRLMQGPQRDRGRGAREVHRRCQRGCARAHAVRSSYSEFEASTM
jgi:hypothetical protein